MTYIILVYAKRNHENIRVVKYLQSHRHDGLDLFLRVVSLFTIQTVQYKIFVGPVKTEKNYRSKDNNMLNWFYEKRIYLVKCCFL